MVANRQQDSRLSLTSQEAYWKERLSGELAPLEFPLDYPRPPVQTFIRATESLEMDRTFVARLRQLCDREGTKLFVTLLAAAKTLLLRSTGHSAGSRHHRLSYIAHGPWTRVE